MNYDRKWLETKMVQVSERFPDRIGFRGGWRSTDSKDHCYIGLICEELGMYGTDLAASVQAKEAWAGWMQELSLNMLIQNAIRLNDRGVKWGEIPKLLGIKPAADGELAPEPVQAPVAAQPQWVYDELSPLAITSAKIKFVDNIYMMVP